MRAEERAALTAVQFNWAVTPDDIWSPIKHHVPGLHVKVVQTVMASVAAARRSSGASPIGIALEGEKGVGKTHLLGWVRQQVQDTEGYFFLIKLVSGASFWPSTIRGIMDGFRAARGHQLTALLDRLGDQAGLSNGVRARLTGGEPVTRQDLDDLITGLQRIDADVAAECRNTARALVLYLSPDSEKQEVGYSYFELDGDVEEADRRRWGFRRGRRLPQEIVGDLSRLLALTGPSVIAVDQLDSLIAQIGTTGTTGNERRNARTQQVNEIADGLMELRDRTHRTLSVVACLPATWNLIRSQAVESAADRFRVVPMQSLMPTPQIARELVGRRLAALYHGAGFVPPYPTWPVLMSAFDDEVLGFTPRRLLQRVDTHIRRCLEIDELVELANLAEEPVPVAGNPRQTAPPVRDRLDATFAELRAKAVVDAAMDPKTEDVAMPALLAAALTSYIAELGEPGRDFELDPPPGSKPALHARLRRTLDERTDDELHWSFRAISSDHGRAALTRLRAATTESGLEPESTKRRLVILRNTPWSAGPKTTEELAAFNAAGGLSLVITEDDLRTFSALDALRRRPDPGFLRWLRLRRPAGNSELFQQVFGEPEQQHPDHRSAGARHATGQSGAADQPAFHRPPDDGRRFEAGSADAPAREQTETMSGTTPEAVTEPVVVLGAGIMDASPYELPLRLLRKHTVAFAGTGSGKTVLLRRLVEECALHGVSSIVLDPNNDLARLGDAWPEPPGGWYPGDAEKARTYLAQTEVVVWTPRRAKGRPLAFRPLPDFADVLDDPDEFTDALDAAVAGLIPRVQLTGRRAGNSQAVLKEALKHFALNGGRELRAFIDLLSDLPSGISKQRNAHKLAGDIADALNAATVNDPLFGGEGEPLDPGVLLTPRSGYRARVSVVSFVGLQAEAQRQSFVNQLQMALFAWIKRNPAGDRPLGGLLVMDEAQTFASSGAVTACTASTLALATQARKYGLGLIFATQAPKALHNRIPGNATTQFYGLLNVVTQINAAKELAKAKGGRVDDIARLTTGEFFAATEGTRFQKIRTPLCLSHHPSSPLTVEEVVLRARASTK